jgi:hypothetical protein
MTTWQLYSPGNWSRMVSIGKEATVYTGKLFLDRSSMESVRLPDPPTRVTAARDVKGTEEMCCIVVEKKKWI